MGEIDEHFQAFADDFVAFFAANIGDESHAAGIVLMARMIEALSRRDAVTAIGFVAMVIFHGSLSNATRREQNYGAEYVASTEYTSALRFWAKKIALPVNPELGVSRTGRIRELRCF